MLSCVEFAVSFSPPLSEGDTFQDPSGCLKLVIVPNPIYPVSSCTYISVMKFVKRLTTVTNKRAVVTTQCKKSPVNVVSHSQLSYCMYGVDSMGTQHKGKFHGLGRMQWDGGIFHHILRMVCGFKLIYYLFLEFSI